MNAFVMKLCSWSSKWITMAYSNIDIHFWGSQEKYCLVFELFEMHTKPVRAFITLLTCLPAWSEPTETNGISLFVIDKIPSSMFLDILSLIHACLARSAMYLGQNHLYFIQSKTKESLFSTSPASRC